MPKIFRTLPPFITLALILCSFSTPLSGAAGPDRFGPLPVGPQHFFYFAYPVYIPDSARVREAGSFTIEFEYSHANLFGKSGNYWVGSEFKGYPVNIPREDRALDFGFNVCGKNEHIKDFDWNCKARGYSIVQDGETLRRSLIGRLGLGMRLELQLIKRDLSFRGGELDHFIEEFHRNFNFSNTDRDSFPRNQFGIYIWDNSKEKFVYLLDTPPKGFQSESRTVSLKFGLIQGDSLALALRYASNFDNRMLHQANQVESQRHEPFDHEDRMLAADLNWAFANWAVHLGYGQTEVARRFVPQSPEKLFFQFYALMARVGDESEWMFQDLTYTSLFPKDGKEALQEPLRERTLGMRVGFGAHFHWQFGIVNNISWWPQNIDGAYFSRFILAF